ncbi:MAG: serine hydrolase domain-containing protein [Eubacteriales bacterium]
MMNMEYLIGNDFNGCVSIVENGKTVYQKAFGFADRANEIPNQCSTRFAAASAGKVFVAVGILQLIEQKILGFDDTLGSLLDIDWKKIDKAITIRQLLCHTSGIPDYFDESTMHEYEELWKDYPNYKIRTSQDIIPLFIDKPMMYPAGQKFQYNNTGYVVLGLIIEKVKGELFDSYLRKNIFEPCQMTDTGYYELDRLPARCANSYILDPANGEYYTNIYSVDVKGTGAGGVFTTVKDIDSFWTCLTEGKLLSKDMLQQMIAPQCGTGTQYYGYGVWLTKEKENTFIPYFQGSDPGVSFLTSYDPARRSGITLVSNCGFNVWKLNRDIRRSAGDTCSS